MEWRIVEGWPDYKVSDEGVVWSIRNNKALKGDKCKDGYSRVQLSKNGKRWRVKPAELVLHHFVCPREEGMVIRHKDANVANDRLDNLQWGTQKQNIHDKWAAGTMVMGERQHLSKLNEAAVRVIRDTKLSSKELAARFGVGRTCINMVRRRHTWKHLP